MRGAIALLALACLGAARPSPLDWPMPAAERGAELVAALSAAGPGAVIELGDATYTAPPNGFRISGKPNVTIRAAPGAHPVLTLRDPRFLVPNAIWNPVEGAPGIFRAAELLGSSIYRERGRKILIARDRVHFDVMVAAGAPAAFRGTGETLLYLRGDDPRATPLWVSSTDAAVLACDRSPGLRLEGLDVRFGGAVGINLEFCHGAALEGVTVFGGRDGVRNKNGSSDEVTVLHCWIVNDYDEEWWHYRDVKSNVTIEGTGISSPGKDHRIEENIVWGFFNGIGTVCSPPCETVDPLIRGNWIEDVADDAIELDGILVRGQISRNLIRNAFVALSLSPRLVRTPGEATWIHHNAIGAVRATPELFDRPTATSPATIARAQGTKLNSHPVIDGVPTAATDLLVEANTFYCEAECWRGAPTGQQAYPSRMRVRWNVFVSQKGPIVRHTGSPADGNVMERNAYWLEGPGLFAENWATGYTGTRIPYTTLAAARSSAPGIAAGWEAEGVYADPLLSRPGEPSSLLPGSPAEGLGAFERAPLRVDAIVRLPTGWVLARGQGFESAGPVPGLEDPVVVGSSLAFAREISDPPPAPPTVLSVDVAP